MTMDDWGCTPIVNKAKNMVQWFGEDVEEEVKDSWEQDAEVENKIVEQNNSQIYQNKKKINQKKEELEIAEQQEEDTSTNSSVDLNREIASKKEEEIRKMAKDIFEVESITSSSDFDKFKQEILSKVNECQKDSVFVEFVEKIVFGLCDQLSTSDTKRIHNVLGNLHLEKCKAAMGKKLVKNKCKLKAKLIVDQEMDIRSYKYAEDYFDY